MCNTAYCDLINNNINRDVQTGCTGYIHIAAIRMMFYSLLNAFFCTSWECITSCMSSAVCVVSVCRRGLSQEMEELAGHVHQRQACGAAPASLRNVPPQLEVQLADVIPDAVHPVPIGGHRRARGGPRRRGQGGGEDCCVWGAGLWGRSRDAGRILALLRVGIAGFGT